METVRGHPHPWQIGLLLVSLAFVLAGLVSPFVARVSYALAMGWTSTQLLRPTPNAFVRCSLARRSVARASVRRACEERSSRGGDKNVRSKRMFAWMVLRLVRRRSAPDRRQDDVASSLRSVLRMVHAFEKADRDMELLWFSKRRVPPVVGVSRKRLLVHVTCLVSWAQIHLGRAFRASPFHVYFPSSLVGSSAALLSFATSNERTNERT